MGNSKKRKEQLAAAAARWRKRNPEFALSYAKRTNYAAQKAWRRRNPEKSREYVRTHRLRNLERIRARSRELNKLKRLADPEGVRTKKRGYYRAMMERRVGRPRPSNCELCGKRFNKQPHADHDHQSGVYRGWICRNCNAVLGLVHDDVEILQAMIAWIEKYRGG